MSTTIGRKRRQKATLSVKRVLARDAQHAAEEAVRRTAIQLGRAFAADRDPDLHPRSLVRHATNIIDKDPTLCDWVQERILASYKAPGRRPDMSARTFLIVAVVHILTNNEFHLDQLHQTTIKLPATSRLDLGLAFEDSRGEAKQPSYSSTRRAFHRIARAFDPTEAELTDEVQAQRTVDLQQLVDRLLAASRPDDLYPGGFAADGTFIGAWYQGSRRSRRNRKTRGTNTSGTSRSSLVATDTPGAFETNDDGIPVDLLSSKPAEKQTRLPSLDPSGGWRNRDGEKPRFGHNVIPVVRSAVGHAALVETLVVTAAEVSEYRSTLPLLERIAASGQPLGNVVADKGFTKYPTWWQTVRELGGTPIADLDAYQEGVRTIFDKDGDIAAVEFNGRIYCPCAARAFDLPNLKFPTLATRDDKKLFKHQGVIAKLDDGFYAKANTATPRANGKWQHRMPHKAVHAADGQAGGCDHCTNKATGQPIVDAKTGRPVPRCCTKHVDVTWHDGIRPDGKPMPPGTPKPWIRQPATYGTAEWYLDLWARRDVVEGVHGILKVGTSYGNPGFHRLRGNAQLTVIATLYHVAYNWQAYRAWNALAAKAERDEANGTTKRSATKANPVAAADGVAGETGETVAENPPPETAPEAPPPTRPRASKSFGKRFNNN